MPDQQATVTKLHLIDAPYFTPSIYDVNVTDHAVTITLKLRLDPQPGVSDAQLQQVQQEATRGVARYFNDRFEFRDP